MPRNVGRRLTGKRPTVATATCRAVDSPPGVWVQMSTAHIYGDPPDVMISPKLAKMGLFEFHRAQECIDLGRQATERALPDIREMIQESQPAV